ncbi:unnamed protein product [Enterobius vermicularis]|uniref:TM2 domain-containing protein n=1 Tax=Enterobius vermicularis TaxID=51028 RepID=A0A0N4V5A7_ENTVE|nr:unnamed protein product [Enterobius vermicularis]
MLALRILYGLCKDVVKGYYGFLALGLGDVHQFMILLLFAQVYWVDYNPFEENSECASGFADYQEPGICKLAVLCSVIFGLFLVTALNKRALKEEMKFLEEPEAMKLQKLNQIVVNSQQCNSIPSNSEKVC